MENPIVVRRRALAFLTDSAAARRAAGFRELERLGELWPQTRRQVFDDICGYLREPLPVGDTKERTVRRIAEEVLARHLKLPSSPMSWECERLDLRNARLFDLDFRDCRVNADFSGAVFSGGTRFEGAWFLDEARFDEARFSGGVFFASAWFHKDARFNARFDGLAGFGSAWFKAGARFSNARFATATGFHKANFSGEALFVETSFAGTTAFDKTVFHDRACFNNAVFGEDTSFALTQFRGASSFDDTRFGSSPCFEVTAFVEEPTGLADAISALPRPDQRADRSPGAEV